MCDSERGEDEGRMRRSIPFLEGLLRGLWRLLPGGVARDEDRPRDHVHWLRDRLFRCESAAPPEVVASRGRPRTERLTGSTGRDDVSLLAWLGASRADEGTRRSVLQECGAELGRMHALGFVHGALTPAGIRVFPDPAVGGPGHGRRISFAAIGAGGSAAWLRGRAVTRARELEALLAGLSPHLGAGDEDVIRRAYANARREQGQPQ